MSSVKIVFFLSFSLLKYEFVVDFVLIENNEIRNLKYVLGKKRRFLKECLELTENLISVYFPVIFDVVSKLHLDFLVVSFRTK